MSHPRDMHRKVQTACANWIDSFLVRYCDAISKGREPCLPELADQAYAASWETDIFDFMEDKRSVTKVRQEG